MTITIDKLVEEQKAAKAIAPRSMPDHGPIAIALPPEKASRSSYQMPVHTDIIGGSYMSTIRAVELLMVDPTAPLEEGCLTVVKFSGSGTAFMTRYTTCGHDGNGRFCKRGSPEEMIRFGNIYMSRKGLDDEKLQEWMHLVGRVVGCDREFPRPLPLTFEEAAE